MSVRLYGPVVGNGSYARVTAGMRHGLEVMGEFAGLVPLDAYDQEETYDGAEAELGVYVGHAGGAVMMQQLGLHEERLVLLPPNSTCVPAELLRYLEKHVTGIVTPSTWGAGILRDLTTLPVELWQHGVDEGFCRSDEAELALDADYVAGQFRVAHLASTAAQRKGTKELLLGWIEAVKAGSLGPNPFLQVIIDGPKGVFGEEVAAAAAQGDLVTTGASIVRLPRGNWSVDNMATFYRGFHAVAAPSRGEGFGLVPLEARACGVPVLATTCTGHADHVLTPRHSTGDPQALLAPGVIEVHTGELEAIDDGEGALGPSLRSQSVAASLERAYHGWAGYAADTRSYAAHLLERWSWPEVTKRWLESRQS